MKYENKILNPVSSLLAALENREELDGLCQSAETRQGEHLPPKTYKINSKVPELFIFSVSFLSSLPSPCSAWK